MRLLEKDLATSRTGAAFIQRLQFYYGPDTGGLSLYLGIIDKGSALLECEFRPPQFPVLASCVTLGEQAT